MKVCCSCVSCLTEIVSQLGERAYVASEYERQVVDQEGLLLRPGYPTEVFYCSWLRCLSVRSILFIRGTFDLARGPCSVHRGSGDRGALGYSRGLRLNCYSHFESQEFYHKISASSGLSSASYPARGSVRPHAQLRAQFGLMPSSELSSNLCPAQGSVRTHA